ncbi:AAA family ATPase, partial [Candidatus Babeliales bacterium]|nr:AAA family ATPase [Candidatus Babeliales bacterium]
MIKKTLGIGVSNFKDIIEKNYYFIDKSLFIREIIKTGAIVTLFPRPRRFGKTLNLSMLQYFFEKTNTSNTHLFKNLEIEKEKEIMQLQGQYPVIFLTFKNIKELTWESSLDKIKELISNEFNRHDYLLKNNFLKDYEQTTFKKIINKTANQAEYEFSLFTLSKWLTDFHNKRPVILIDEYDSPITAGYLNNYYAQIISF